MQRDTTVITAENKELKLRLQAMEQQAQLRDGMHIIRMFVLLWNRSGGIVLLSCGSKYLELSS